MAPAGNYATPHRTFITYGKSSRASKSAKVTQSSSTSSQTQTPDPLTEEPPKTPASASRTTVSANRKGNGDIPGRPLPGALQSSKLLKPSRPNILPHRTSSYAEEQSVFDIDSSGDEQQHEKNEPWRKRRKIETPKKIEWASKGFDNVATPSPQRAGRHTHDDSHGQNGTSPTKISGIGEKTGEIEVVIRTPKCQKWFDESTGKGKAMAGGGESNSGPSCAFNNNCPTHKLQRGHSPCRNPEPSPSRPLDQRSLKSPINKLAQPTQQAKELPPKTPPSNRKQKEVVASRATINLEDVILDRNGATNTTTPRRRLVDALTPGGRPGSLIDSDGVDVSAYSTISRASTETSSESEGDSIYSAPQLANTTPEAKDNSQFNPPARLQHSQSSGFKITYARQRSFLSAENIAAEDPILEIPPQPSFSKPNGAGHSVSSLLGSKSARPLAPQVDEDDDESSNGAVRNIYELRRAGENARFEAIIDAIFEDIEDSTSSTSRRYSGLIQLCEKLMDRQFARRFLAHGLEKRLAKRSGHFGGDTVYIYLVACAYGLVLSTGSVSSVVLHTCSGQIFKSTPKMITEKSDILHIAKLGATRTSKTVQGSLQDFCEQLSRSKVWSDVQPKKHSPQILALRCIEMAVRRARESGEAVGNLSNPLLSQLVDLLLQHSELAENQSTKSDGMLIIELAFSILESYTVLFNSLDKGQERILKKLSALGPLLSRLSDSPESHYRQIQLLEIRLILNLTNNNPSLCEDFSTPELVGALMGSILSNFGTVSEDMGSDKRDSMLDTVILALGTLINLTEWNGTARQLILKTRSDDSATFLDRLLVLFKYGWEKTSEADSVVQTHYNVAFGYLSVLLSTVSLDDEARLHLRKSLDGGNINRVLGTVDEFLHYHRKVEKEVHDGEGEHESMSGFTTRLQGIVDRIKQAEGLS
ncbi:hypothetical protein AJ79_06675 [Helicocarpus griseus UAMH5409]|uniref:Wings apart-like protein C-terminal domain-containing protein n=1 Tax=Helicocarpus griseus UAMH5409 TaxID=1447875 RepID=A0A2B7XA58_9EURO|nr:hypothetical protein AJ79_06675 [Helicocarpus griseus UAMH5409]